MRNLWCTIYAARDATQDTGIFGAFRLTVTENRPHREVLEGPTFPKNAKFLVVAFFERKTGSHFP